MGIGEVRSSFQPPISSRQSPILICAGLHGAFTAPRRVLPQPLIYVIVERPRGFARIPETEILLPPRCLPVDFVNHLWQRFETLRLIGQLVISRPFPHHRRFRRCDAQVPLFMRIPIPVVAERVAQKIQAHARPTQLDDAGLLPLDRQAHPVFQPAFDLRLQGRVRRARQHDEIVGVASQLGQFGIRCGREATLKHHVEPAQKQVRQQRRDDPVLRCPLPVWTTRPALVRLAYGRLQPLPDQFDDLAVGDPVADTGQQFGVFNRIEV